LEIEVKDTKDKYESFDIRFKKKEKECRGYEASNIKIKDEFETLSKISAK